MVGGGGLLRTEKGGARVNQWHESSGGGDPQFYQRYVLETDQFTVTVRREFYSPGKWLMDCEEVEIHHCLLHSADLAAAKREALRLVLCACQEMFNEAQRACNEEGA